MALKPKTDPAAIHAAHLTAVLARQQQQAVIASARAAAARQSADELHRTHEDALAAAKSARANATATRIAARNQAVADHRAKVAAQRQARIDARNSRKGKPSPTVYPSNNPGNGSANDSGTASESNPTTPPGSATVNSGGTSPGSIDALSDPAGSTTAAAKSGNWFSRLTTLEKVALIGGGGLVIFAYAKYQTVTAPIREAKNIGRSIGHLFREIFHG